MANAGCVNEGIGPGGGDIAPGEVVVDAGEDERGEGLLTAAAAAATATAATSTAATSTANKGGNNAANKGNGNAGATAASSSAAAAATTAAAAGGNANTGDAQSSLSTWLKHPLMPSTLPQTC